MLHTQRIFYKGFRQTNRLHPLSKNETDKRRIYRIFKLSGQEFSFMSRMSNVKRTKFQPKCIEEALVGFGEISKAYRMRTIVFTEQRTIEQ